MRLTARSWQASRVFLKKHFDGQLCYIFNFQLWCHLFGTLWSKPSRQANLYKFISGRCRAVGIKRNPLSPPFFARNSSKRRSAGVTRRAERITCKEISNKFNTNCVNREQAYGPFKAIIPSVISRSEMSLTKSDYPKPSQSQLPFDKKTILTPKKS